MLGTLLDKLESLFSKSFVVGSIPLLAFLFFNALMLYVVSESMQKWIRWYYTLDATRLAVVSFAFLLAVITLSYVLSTLTVFLREVLEGKHLEKREWLYKILSQRYRKQLAGLEDNLRNARRSLRKIRREMRVWQAKMSEARKHGNKNEGEFQYTRRPKLADLLKLQETNSLVDPALIPDEVNHLETVLNSFSADSGTGPSKDLDRDHVALYNLIEYAADRWQAEVTRFFNEIQFNFPGKDVAPTRMGNIASTARSYAQSRYSMNLDIFWTRLQKVLKGDSNFYPILLEAKMQLDFLVTLFWLTVIFTLIWTVSLPFYSNNKWLFLWVVMAGPTLSFIWYKIALQNYRAFADLLRSAVDLYRLDLLKVLHVPLPANAEEERHIWETLGNRSGYRDDVNYTFQHPGP